MKIFRGTPPAPISIDYQLRIRSCLKFNREIKNFHSFFLSRFFRFAVYQWKIAWPVSWLKFNLDSFISESVNVTYTCFSSTFISLRVLFLFFFFFQRVIKWKNTRRRLSRSTLTYCLFSFPFKCHSFVFFFARKISKRNIPKFRHLSLFFLSFF